MPYCRHCHWQGNADELDAYPLDSAYDYDDGDLLDFECPACGSDDIGGDDELDEDRYLDGSLAY